MGGSLCLWAHTRRQNTSAANRCANARDALVYPCLYHFASLQRLTQEHGHDYLCHCGSGRTPCLPIGTPLCLVFGKSAVAKMGNGPGGDVWQFRPLFTHLHIFACLPCTMHESCADAKRCPCILTFLLVRPLMLLVFPSITCYSHPMPLRT